jgi:phosphomannomutase
MHEEIFKSYDVRGIVPEELDAETAYKIGRAFVCFLGCRRVFVGYDMRVSSKELKDALLKGIADQGAEGVDIGQVSTDTVYFASGKSNSPGIMLTASHNPKQYNGMKFCKEGAQALSFEDGLKQIKEIVEKDDFPEADNKGKVVEQDVLDLYFEKLISLVDKDKIKKMKIAVDAGNGMAGKMIPLLAKKLPQLEIVPLYFELDGTFPNHPANPIDLDNLKDLMAKIKEEKADMGLAFDGDADRVYLVDDKGDFVTASETGAMVIKKMLEKNPGSKIIHNVVCSWIVPETIEKFGGKAIETKVGHSIIKPIMKKEDAIFGTEHSGHYYFKDLFYADSGILATLFILELISEQDQPLSEVLKEFRTYYSIEETNTEVKDKDKVIEAITGKFKNDPDVISFKDFDGVRVDFEDWWFNVRPSNTEPLLRLNLEAKTPELMEKKKKEMIELIKNVS